MPINRLARQLRTNQTDAEKQLWHHLRGRRLQGHRFRRQAPIGAYIVNFVCFDQKLIIELDGGQHLEHAAEDTQRTAELEMRGYRVIRFWNHEVLTQIDPVLDKIHGELNIPHPGLLPEGEGVKLDIPNATATSFPLPQREG